MTVIPRRGDIYLINFSPARGKEMKDLHPCLVIQNEIGNQASALTMVAAITSNLKVARLPVAIIVEPEESGLHRKSVVHLGHIYTVDQERLGRFTGRLTESKMKTIDEAIEISLGLKRFVL